MRRIERRVYKPSCSEQERIDGSDVPSYLLDEVISYFLVIDVSLYGHDPRTMAHEIPFIPNPIPQSLTHHSEERPLIPYRGESDKYLKYGQD